MASKTAHDSEPDHRDIWFLDERFIKWRSHQVTVLAGLDLKVEELVDRTNLALSTKLAAQTIRRHYAGHHQPRRMRDHSMLITVARSLCVDRGVELPEATTAFVDRVVTALHARIPETRAWSHRPAESSLLTAAAAEAVVIQPRHGNITAVKARRFLAAVPAARPNTDPDLPEFPFLSPRYPATPCIVADFLEPAEPFSEVRERKWKKYREIPYKLIIKDESYNPTGSHKDRWALEKLLIYREVVKRYLDQHDRDGGPINVPPMSMISSGSAAFALQALLGRYGLPPLRVVMADDTDEKIITALRSIGALVRKHNLHDNILQVEDVLRLTHNPGGQDITTRDVATPAHEFFYDWLSCEILKLEPTYVFLPIGTADLFANLLAMIEQENGRKPRDPRLEGISSKKLRGIHVLGATTKDASSRMTKLYAPHTLTHDGASNMAEALIAKKIIGTRSGIYELEDSWAVEAESEAEELNIRTEPSGIAGLGLLRKMESDLALTKDDRVVVVNTGHLATPR